VVVVVVAAGVAAVRRLLVTKFCRVWTAAEVASIARRSFCCLTAHSSSLCAVLWFDTYRQLLVKMVGRMLAALPGSLSH
jgi:hypothetical protein